MNHLIKKNGLVKLPEKLGLLKKVGKGIVTFMLVFSCTIFLSLFFGCNSVDTIVEETPPSDPEVEVTPPREPEVEVTPPREPEVVGITGPIFPIIAIEYFYKGTKGLLMMDEKEMSNYYKNNEMNVEFISAIDEITGKSFIERHEDKVIRNYFSFAPEQFEPWFKETIRHYTVKFKVPSIKGESVEEIKYNYHFIPGFHKITEAWYNGQEIPFFDMMEINKYAHWGFPEFDLDEYKRKVKETYYSGKLVGITFQSTIHIVIPME